MKARTLCATLSVALINSTVWAQAPIPAPAAPEAVPAVMVTPSVIAAPALELPANTELLLSMNEELTSKKVEEGHNFSMTVAHDVRLGDYVVIPKGTRGVGEVTWRTGKGAFGKSGKMDIELRYLDLNGRRVPIEGKYRQEGEGNTVATVAGVVAVGVFAVFITGKSARIPQGRELKAHTREALPVVLRAAAAAPVVQPVVATPAPVAEVRPAAMVEPLPAAVN
ncbi:hypothetical protein [Sphingomonas cavernae]|uniref:Uncharacterized protein n=1 Tax=Sphingomonas cavernae TaxID=2320861 RepID=A0A418W6B9_9SPHN|nr:hypothetical protein [Sphingomonas cavernae]RJF85518.1 hypothetical protein D3876_16435 [Sphingomonas cavernae]